MFANISLVLTFLVYLALLKFGSEKVPGGDYGVGHSLLGFLLYGGLLLTSLTTTVAIASNGGFAWAPGQGGARKVLLGLGWVAFCITTIVVTGYHSGDEKLPFWMNWILWSGGRFWWPLLTLGAAFLLANASFWAGKTPSDASAPAGFFQIAMKIAFFLNVLFCLGMFLQIQLNRARAGAAVDKSNETFPDLEEVNRVACISDSSARALWYIGHSKKFGVRNEAYLKLSKFEDMNGELMRVFNLEHDYWELYGFLAGYNQIPSDDFEVHFERSIRRLAGQIRAQDAHESFQKSKELDGLNICRLVETLDKRFFASEIDYRPAMRNLQEVLAAEPKEVFQKEREAVAEWLKAHP